LRNMARKVTATTAATVRMMLRTWFKVRIMVTIP
jgi:hypothetical protein